MKIAEALLCYLSSQWQEELWRTASLSCSGTWALVMQHSGLLAAWAWTWHFSWVWTSADSYLTRGWQVRGLSSEVQNLLATNQLIAHLLPYQKKRVQKPMLMLSPSTYQLNTTFKLKGMQTNLTFIKIAQRQQICCNPEDRCITTKKDFVMNVLITMCHG